MSKLLTFCYCDFVKFCGWSGAQESKLDRLRQELFKEDLGGNIGIDTPEKEPLKVC